MQQPPKKQQGFLRSFFRKVISKSSARLFLKFASELLLRVVKKTFKLFLFLHFLIRFKLFNKNKNSVRPFTCKVCVNNRIKRQNYSEYDFQHRKRGSSLQQLILIAFILLLPFKSLSFFFPLNEKCRREKQTTSSNYANIQQTSTTTYVAMRK